jgi:penicillin-binding protein 1C
MVSPKILAGNKFPDYIVHRKKTIFFLFLLVIYAFSLPKALFNQPTSMVLEDKNGNLLGARIAADGQWRFPYQKEVPEKYIKALVCFEDKRFWYHFGIDPLSLVRAIGQNIRGAHIVSGGSTVTMQVIRMSRSNPPRTIFQKIIEAILATRLELTHSKKKILALYASNAPYGGNVVGLDAASWRYFGKQAALLSWAEAATLAVLPNSPALIHPARNRNTLLEKRNRLLDKMQQEGIFDATTCSLAKDETLPDAPYPLPRLAPHLLDRAYLEHFSGKKEAITRIRTTIDLKLQENLNELLANHQNRLSGNGIHNIASVILDTETGNILAYTGNVMGAGKTHGEDVDIIRAPRSTGSILKPFLYALALQEGIILPNSLMSDIPIYISGFQPENFLETYDGVVPARRALARSLNIPMVRLLNEYGVERFHYQLKNMGFSTFTFPSSRYGLSLILGGAEANLLEITNAYTCMARVVSHFPDLDGKYDLNDWHTANYIFQNSIKKPKKIVVEAPLLSAAAIYATLDAMKEVERPTAEGNWEVFQSSRTVAWKTGTSFGFRDAWAVGTTPRYTVGIWVGNADGEGRPGLVGVEAAAPILFDIFERLPTSDWFSMPYDDMQEVKICQKSGDRALDFCPSDSMFVPKTCLKATACERHQLLHLDKTTDFQVSSECEQPENMRHEAWFTLSPAEEFYFKNKNPDYKSLPPFRVGCGNSIEKNSVLQLIYPKHAGTRIYVPIDFDGKSGKTVFKAAHRNAAATVHWHLDAQYIGSTKEFHQLEWNPPVGKHVLTLVDDVGNQLEQAFEVLGRKG